jgi:hypothetical protein
MSNPSIPSLGIGLMLAAAATTCAVAADKSYSVTEQVDLKAAPARTWATIQDFKGWQTWHPAFASTVITKGEGNTKGSVRELTTGDGAKFIEELVTHDAASRKVQYRIIESPLPIAGYVSTLEVRSGRDGGSTVVWSSHFGVKPGASDEEIKKTIAGVYRAGLDNLAAAVK